MPLTCLLSGCIQLSPEQTAQLHLCHFLQFSLVRFKRGNRKHYLGKNISQCAVCAAKCLAQMFHRDIANCFHNFHSLVRVPWVVAVCSLDYLKAEVVSFSHLPFIASLSKFACVPRGCLDLNDMFFVGRELMSAGPFRFCCQFWILT